MIEGEDQDRVHGLVHGLVLDHHDQDRNRDPVRDSRPRGVVVESAMLVAEDQDHPVRMIAIIDQGGVVAEGKIVLHSARRSDPEEVQGGLGVMDVVAVRVVAGVEAEVMIGINQLVKQCVVVRIDRFRQARGGAKVKVREGAEAQVRKEVRVLRAEMGKDALPHRIKIMCRE